jgi:hypothetical protein
MPFSLIPSISELLRSFGRRGISYYQTQDGFNFFLGPERERASSPGPATTNHLGNSVNSTRLSINRNCALGEGGFVKKLTAARVDSTDGETHYILRKSPILDRSGSAEELGEVKIKKITKKEASKPLFLTRQE